MKYYGLFALLLLLAAFTVNLTLPLTPTLSPDTHIAIREQLESLIKKTVRIKHPSAKTIHFNKIWTESIQIPPPIQQVRATFDYQIQFLNTDSVSIAGYAILEKVLNNDQDKKNDKDNTEEWTIKKLKGERNSLSFNEGITIYATDR